MASPQAIVIGTYCSDFTIDQPMSGQDFYYYKATSPLDSTDYYIATSRVTNGDTGLTSSSTVKIIKSPIVLSSSGSVTIDSTADANFQEFRFKLVWDPKFVPDFTTTTAVIPTDFRRYLTWRHATAADTGQVYTASKTDRFVKLETANDNIKGVTFSGVSAASGVGSGATPSLTTSSNFALNSTSTGDGTAANPSISSLKFETTKISPTVQTRATQLKYLIFKEDFDKLTTDAATAQKQLRYLIWDNSAAAINPPARTPPITTGRFELRDLYDPNVTTSLIQRTAYRLSSQTNYTLTATPDGGSTTRITGTITAVTKVSSWGIDLYHNPNGSVSLSASDSNADPGGYTVNKAYRTIFNTETQNAGGRTNGFIFSDFSKTGVSVTGDSSLTTLSSDGFQDWVITIPSLDYQDFTDGSDAGQTITGASNMQFVITNQLVDKSVEELFTNLHVTLLKVQRLSSSPQFLSPTGSVSTGNQNFLGLENVTPASNPPTQSALTLSGVAANGSNAIELIVRDYYKFYDPVRAAQFKFYDLGRGIEYLWQARWPSGSGDIYTYVGVNGTTVTYYPSSAITETTRGWIMEWDNTITPPGIKMKWGGATSAATAYIGLTGTGSNDGSPYRINPTLVASSAAAVFNCIQCSSIDSTGACLPISPGAYFGTQTPPGGGTRGRSPISMMSSGSPVPTEIFRIRLSSTSGSILQYTVTQIAGGSVQGSPGSGVFRQGTQASPVVTLSSIPSQVPAGAVIEFQFTRTGSMSPRSTAAKAVFIKAVGLPAGSPDMYLKFNQALSPSSNQRVELIASNNPSDDDGFAWIVVGSGPYNLYSVSTLVSPSPSVTNRPTNRYLQTNGFTLGPAPSPSTLGFVFESGGTAITSPSIVNATLPAA